MSGGNQSIDTPLLRVPFESLRRTARDRKGVLDEVYSVVSTLKSSDGASSQQEAAVALDAAVSRLQSLKRKLVESAGVECDEANRCRVRLAHLAGLGGPPKDGALGWNAARMDRILADHMLRAGHLESALQLAKEGHIEIDGRASLFRLKGVVDLVQDLVDTHVFLAAKDVLDSLNRHDCSPALAWCEENRQRLRKLKSKLEFTLRVQEFVELVRQERMLDAIAYSRRHLSPWASQYQADLQRALAALAFRAGTACAPYAALFNEAAWRTCAEIFCRDLYRLHSMPPLSQLTVHLQAGLSALKTPQSYAANSSREDPLTLEKFQKLAEGLPWSKHVHSKLVCSITRELMNEHNPPMVLPNGAVYSEKAVQHVASKNHGIFTCPKTGVSCDVKDMRRAYIS